jgi:integrase
MRGVDLKVVQAWLGHATMEMTLRYARLIPKARTHGVDRLDEPIPEWAREESHSTPMALDGGA